MVVKAYMISSYPLFPFCFAAKMSWLKEKQNYIILLLKSVQWPLVSVKAKDKFLIVIPKVIANLDPLLSLLLSHYLPSFSSCSHTCRLTVHLADL